MFVNEGFDSCDLDLLVHILFSRPSGWPSVSFSNFTLSISSRNASKARKCAGERFLSRHENCRVSGMSFVQYSVEMLMMLRKEYCWSKQTGVLCSMGTLMMWCCSCMHASPRNHKSQKNLALYNFKDANLDAIEIKSSRPCNRNNI